MSLLPCCPETNAARGKCSPQLFEINLGHEVMSGAEELSGLQVESSKVQAQLQHAVTAEGFGIRAGEPRRCFRIGSGGIERIPQFPLDRPEEGEMS